MTVTANADIPVDNSGYEIQIYDLSTGAHFGTCSTGSSRRATESDPNGSCAPSTYTYQAFVDKASQGSAIPSSKQVTVTWSVLRTPALYQTASIKGGMLTPLVAWRDSRAQAYGPKLALTDTKRENLETRSRRCIHY